MLNENINFADQVAKLCYDHYRSLGKSGKPIKGEEWTLLSGIVVMFNKPDNDYKLKLASLATGSKCIGRNLMSSDGDIVNDSHAEVLARRCFLRYVYDQINLIRSGKESEILVTTSTISHSTDGIQNYYESIENEKTNELDLINLEKYELRSGVTFHLFSSHMPCGDASIIPISKCNSDKNAASDENLSSDDGVEQSRNKRTYNVLDCNNDGTSCKKLKSCNSSKNQINEDNLCNNEESNNSLRINDDSDFSESVGRIVSGNIIDGNCVDMYRTGAKCVPTDPRQDNKGNGINYHTVGAVRTKPGRGDPTLSVSCSDKIARWIAVGMQGALLSQIINKPIILSSIIIGAGGPFSKVSLHHAILGRTRIDRRVEILLSHYVFEMSKYSPDNINAKHPSPAALMWSDVQNGRQTEVAVNGRRLGTTKKSKHKGSLLVCKKELFKLFHKVTNKKFINESYKRVKLLSQQYQSEWTIVKNNFGAWTEKPSCLLNFNIGDKDL